MKIGDLSPPGNLAIRIKSFKMCTCFQLQLYLYAFALRKHSQMRNHMCTEITHNIQL